MVDPPARRTAMVVQRSLDDVVVVYDVRRDRMVRLDRVTAAVWTACDGGTGVAALAVRCDLDEDAVLRALCLLQREELLERRHVAREAVTAS